MKIPMNSPFSFSLTIDHVDVSFLPKKQFLIMSFVLYVCVCVCVCKQFTSHLLSALWAQ